ncbi:protein translocase subunit SecF [Yinghuangia seranimata]|uniref:protein translocase subunit SecF n=1 Tax=Yinghuangia seranimata TaxID=408067 RepID=UPI00248BB752|nr:protein translocase subunit SecF [Yinghuangia seranimata]MDI2132717.1 protein translocase subunit SecF [Yinghuangia seranimata]
MSRLSGLRSVGHKLYTGELEYDFVGKKKRWYALSAVILILAIGGLLGRGISKGIEFEGGAVYTVSKPGVTVSAAHDAIAPFTGDHEPIVQKVGGDKVRIQIASKDTAKFNQIKDALSTKLGVDQNKIESELVGPSWGKEISNKALQGLLYFMIAVVIYLSIAFEWRMALAALVALIHDIVITIGVYALVGFEVTPGTVIGLLTILGYSLYDTVVVFDTVKENTKAITKQNKMTFSEAANRGLNQTLVRSINTSVVALLPVASLLFVGGGLLGAGMLKDIALSLFVGLAAGAFSSIFIATPLYADLKERTPEMRALAKRVATHRAAQAKAAAARGADADEAGAAGDGDDRDDTADEDHGETAGAGSGPRVSGPRRQPVSSTRNRRPGRPSGKRKH